MNKLNFSKMHGLGNDFIIINALNNKIDFTKLPIKQLADRYQGIGCDQLLIIESSDQADFFCRIFNADGSEAEQCGNGLRCVARYLLEHNLHPHSQLKIQTKAGIFSIQVKSTDVITVNLAAPVIDTSIKNINLNGTLIDLTVLCLGNPHAVLKVEAVKSMDIAKLGAQMAMLPLFPNGVNVGFMQILNRKHILLRTYERGVGETRACGSNACAAVCAGIVNGWLDNEVNVEFQFGKLNIAWKGKDATVALTGPATQVFDGEMALPTLSS